MLSDEQVEPKWRARAAAFQITYAHAVADLDWRASRVVAYRGFTSEYVTTIAGVIATTLQDQLVEFAKRLTAALPGTSVMSALDVVALLDSQIAWGGAFDVLRGVLLQQVTTTNRTLTWLGLFTDRRRREKRPDPFGFSAFENGSLVRREPRQQRARAGRCADWARLRRVAQGTVRHVPVIDAVGIRVGRDPTRSPAPCRIGVDGPSGPAVPS
jgi:hypothetical protein